MRPLRFYFRRDPTSAEAHRMGNGRVLPSGSDVQVFDLAGHPTATRAYAWSHATECRQRQN
ncbi:MAG: hypothetical protein Q8S73_23440 [Deltaproteobacteria bacterium]|nr:hypothetical protein [Myxococcales bacterium]MDP3217084.1 hypothetical protein [Deltaproteobacteria bacterium]